MAIQVTPLRPIPSFPPATGFQAFREAHPSLVDEIKRLRAYRGREFARLGTLPGRDRHSLTRKLIRTPRLHRLYAYEGLRRAHQLGTATPERVTELAEQCNPLQPCFEGSRSRYVGNGTHRRIVNVYGPAKRGRQMMVADLLRSLHPPLVQQFLYRGGMPAAFRAVEAAYAEGFTWGVEVDFVGFYRSVGLEGLAELLRPLPSSVVNHVVWDRATGSDDVVADTVSTSLQWAYPSLNGQQGIALGSACSPQVGELILARLIAPTADCQTVAYADNILVVGRSPEAVGVCVEAMQRRASSFDGWSLRPRMRDDGIKALASHGFDFLHHEAHIDDSGRFTWSPDYRKLAEFLIVEADDHSPSGPPTLALIAEAEMKVCHWRRAYPRWPDGDLWETTQLAALAAQRYYLEASPLNRAQAANALVAAYFARGRRWALEELAPTGTSLEADRRRAGLISTAMDRLMLMARASNIPPTSVALRM